MLKRYLIQNRWFPFDYIVDGFLNGRIGCSMLGHLARNGRKVESGIRGSLSISIDEELSPQGTRIFAILSEGRRDSRFATTRISSQPEKVRTPRRDIVHPSLDIRKDFNPSVFIAWGLPLVIVSCVRQCHFEERLLKEPLTLLGSLCFIQVIQYRALT